MPRDLESLEEEWRATVATFMDPMIVKLDARSGAIVWWKRYPAGHGNLTGVAVDREGGVAIAGEFMSTLEVGEETFYGSPIRWNGFIAKLAPDGAALWLQQIDMESNGSGLSLALMPDSGDIVTGATFLGALRFGMSVMSQEGLQDIMVARLAAATGDVVWVRTFGGADAEEVGDLAVDAGGRIALHGAFSGEIDLGDGPLFAEPEWRDVFVASLDAGGALRWAQRFGGAGPDRPGRVAIGRHDEIMVAGSFTPPFEIGDTLLPESEDESVIVLQLEP
jgi:hypothetical protein